MHAVKTRIAGALALLALGLFAASPAAAAEAAGAPASIFTALPPAPFEGVTDNARMLSPEARARLEAKLKQFRDTHVFVRVYVYTLRSSNGSPPSAAAQELYRRWKMKDREITDGLATIFVFWDEKKALVMLGQGAPPTTEAALADLSPALAAVFGDDPEGALARIVDRIGDSLSRADSTSWLDSPPVPAEPSGPVHGNPDFARRSRGARARGGRPARLDARAPDRPRPESREGTGRSRSSARRSWRRAWPDLILVVAFRADLAVFLEVPESSGNGSRRTSGCGSWWRSGGR